MNRPFFLATIIAGSALLGGCATGDTGSAKLYDLGPIRTQAASTAPTAPGLSTTLPSLSVGEVKVPTWLDSQAIVYRLNYANDQMPQSYANSKWAMPPGQLFGERLKSRLSRAGGVVVPASDGAVNIPLMTIEADDFSQVFDSAGQSHAQVSVRASIYDGRFLRTQKLFVKHIPADSADARGGAAALTAASDAIIDDMAVWLANLPPKK